MRQKKEYDFVVTLKHANYFLYDIISILMCVIAVIISIFAIVNSTITNSGYVSIVLICFILSYLVFALIKRKKTDKIINYKYALLAGAVIWFLPPVSNYFFTALYIVAALLERQVKFPNEIGFAKDGITINSFPNKFFTWKEIANVVLKDEMLTVDFKNNKILQKPTESETTRELENEFNQFCREQIISSMTNNQ